MISELRGKGLKWARIAQQLPGRNRKQCRERWHNALDPQLNKRSWSAEDDAKLDALQASLGNKWAKIAAEFPGRCVPPVPYAPLCCVFLYHLHVCALRQVRERHQEPVE